MRFIAHPVLALLVVLLLGAAGAFGIATDRTFGYVLLGLAALVLVIAIVTWWRRNHWRLQWPLTNAPKVVSPPAGMDFRLEFSREQHENQQLRNDLQLWGLDRAGRKYLKQTMDEFPVLPVNVAKDFAGLLYAAYQKPFTEFRVVLTAGEGNTGTITMLSLNRSITFPIETARAVHNRMEQLIEDAKNDRTKETGLSPS